MQQPPPVPTIIPPYGSHNSRPVPPGQGYHLDWLFVGEEIHHAPIPNPATPPPPPVISHRPIAGINGARFNAPPPPAFGSPVESTGLMNPLLMVHGVVSPSNQQML
mgnify:CR=1 FL=1